MSREHSFAAELWRKLADYLEKYKVGGRKLKAFLEEVSYYGKTPDIVVVDEQGLPQLIIETKRKHDTGHKDLYDPLEKAPVAQALCYASLAMEHHQMEVTPLFATANEDEMYVFKGVEKGELKNLVDIDQCKGRHPRPEDWEKALKPGGRLFGEYLLGRLERPLREDTIKRLFDEYVAKWIAKAPITPQELYRVLVDRFRKIVERFHAEYVEDAVKARILGDPKYFEKLYNLALNQGYPRGILSPGLLTLCVNEDPSVVEHVCRPLADVLADAIPAKGSVQETFNVLSGLASKKVKELVGYCEEAAKGERIPPSICNEEVKELISFRNLSRLMAYALAMKILAYKVLELHHRDIPPLKPLEIKAQGNDKFVEVNGERVHIGTSDDIVKALNKFFENALNKLEKALGVRDFKPLFKTGLYDEVVFKGIEEPVERVNDLIETADAIKEALGELPGVIGYVYEGFIPPRERHQLGQFYTPPAVARLITRWAVRSGDDRVLDGGCGSGTFLIEAYKRILFLKFNKEYGESYPSCHDTLNEHQEVLERLYGVDINAFATQLTSLHLMLMEPKCPFSRLNVEPRDFFELGGSTLLASERVELFDAVIGNPPYTRWVEIPDKTRKLISRSLGNLMQEYDLKPDISGGREPGIYVYWVLHAAKNLLRDGGRLGMIVSNMWLQTDYGVGFGRFLLDNFKVRALIDISYRLFDALISTVIVLAEKEPDEKARGENMTLLARIPPIDSELGDREVEARLNETLRCIENTVTSKYEFDEASLEKCRQEYGIWYRFVKQSEIPRDRKWISLFFSGVEDIVNRLEKLADEGELMIRADEWFKPSYGNALYLYLTSTGRIRGVRNLGAKEFFYFSDRKVEDWDKTYKGFRDAVKDYLVPAITAARYVKTFKFTKEDWQVVRERGRRAYAWILILHKRRDELPQVLQRYIEWGESGCRTKIRATRGGGKVCSEAEACRAREENKTYFRGWYDLGGYVPTPIMAIRQAGYHPQFFLATMPLVTYDAIITFIPRVKVKVGNWVFDPNEYNREEAVIDNVKSDVELDEVKVKALLAYLNSTFNWIWLEQTCRRTGGGTLGLEVDIAERMPILNVVKADPKDVEKLAELFEKLDAEARRIMRLNTAINNPQGGEESGGVSKLEMFERLKPIFREIDEKIAEILDMRVDVDELWKHAWEMMERRVKGAGRRVRPGVEVDVEIKRSKKGNPRKNIIPLTRWIKSGSEDNKL